MSVNTYTSNVSNAQHTYETPGKYQVKITDDIQSLAFGYSTAATYSLASSITGIDHFGPNLTAIGQYCFYYCTKLKNIDFSDSNITNIDAYAFRYSGLSSLTIPSQISSVGSYSFANISTLNDISVSPDNQYFDSRDNSHALINSDTDTLLYASNQTTHIPSDITAVGIYSFSGRTLSAISIPPTVTTFGTTVASMGIFFGCQNLVSVDFPTTFTATSHASMFRDCTSLVSVYIPDNYKTTGTYSFSGDTSLQYVKMSNALTAVGGYAFADCKNDNLVVDFSSRTLTTIPSCVATSFYDRSTSMPMQTNFKILVPSQLLTTWKSTTNWVTIADHIVSSL